MNGWWLTGITDGEGCFCALVDKRYRSIRAEFQINLVSSDAEVLFHIQKFLGVGKIYFWKDKRPNAQDRVGYRVQSYKEFNRVFRHFEEYPLQTKKAYDFACWKELINAYRSGDKEKAWVLVEELRGLHTKVRHRR